MNLIVIEGLDGSGKSTQIAMLQDYLKNKNIKSEFLHFPRLNDGIFGELIARFLRGEFGKNDEVNPYLVALLYALDRYDAKSLLKKWIEIENKIVILDRYVHSNIAYQCAKLDNPIFKKELRDWIYNLEFNYFNIPKPDISIFLDVPIYFIAEKLSNIRIGDDRNYLNGGTDIHEENINFQIKVRETYLWAQQYDETIKVLNCYDNKNNILPKEIIFEKLLNLLEIKI